MKLNADILFDHLSQSVHANIHRRRRIALHLRRPEFYTGNSRKFLSDHVYLSFSDRLLDNPRLNGDCVIISIGGLPGPQYLDNKCTCIVVEDAIDMFSLSNLVNSIYDLFDEWEDKLHRLLETSADIKEMVDASEAVFDAPLIVLDKNFKYLAISEGMAEVSEYALWHPDEKDNIPLEGFAVAMEKTQIDMSSRQPYNLNVVYPSLCTNLFGKDQYIGSVTLAYVEREERRSDVALIKMLAPSLEEAILKLPNMELSRQNVLREVLTDLLVGLPVSQKQLHILSEFSPEASYICIKYVLPKKLQKAPLEYICGMVESSLTNTIAMYYETNVVSFTNVAEAPNGLDKLRRELQCFLTSTKIKAGTSYCFSNLPAARSFYRQACIAVEHAELLKPEFVLSRFEDCSLSYLIAHSTGEFPLDILLPDCIKQLLDMDSKSKTDYIQTLRAYLDNNLNISKSAQALFLHRSSFLERLQRIQNVLKMDLHDPDARIQIEILLRAMALNEQINRNRDRN